MNTPGMHELRTHCVVYSGVLNVCVYHERDLKPTPIFFSYKRIKKKTENVRKIVQQIRLLADIKMRFSAKA